MSGFFKEAWRPVHRLRGRRSKEVAFLQGEAKDSMDPENLVLYSPRRQRKKRTEKKYEEAVRFPRKSSVTLTSFLTSLS